MSKIRDKKVIVINDDLTIQKSILIINLINKNLGGI
jgi:hypothetical protein